MSQRVIDRVQQSACAAERRRAAPDYLAPRRQLCCRAGRAIFIPRNVVHAWVSAGDNPAKIIDVYQPVGKIEDFFRQAGSYSREQPIHEVMPFDQFRRLFEDHGMKLAGAPLEGEWKVSDEGRMVRVS